MKILSANQTREADRFTMKNEPISSIDLMERASKAFVEQFLQKYNIRSDVAIFCGPGNNGGDGLAIARLLYQEDYFVSVWFIGEPSTNDCLTNLKRFQEIGTVNFISDRFDEQLECDIIIDAIFGYGLNRKIAGVYEEVIEKLNQHDSSKVSVDIPSGISADQGILGTFYQADLCITFQLPKLAFFMSKSGETMKKFAVVDIGLNKNFIQEQETLYNTIDVDFIKKTLRNRNKFSHKGTYGHALICGGSKGMMGAMVLSCKAALRTGAGLITTCIPGNGLTILQTAVPEVMVLPDNESDYLSKVPDLEKFNAIGIGPSMGKHNKTVQFLTDLLETTDIPMVIDADGLNILSENRELLSLLKRNTILTPHPGEFKRLVGEWTDDLDMIKKQIAFSQKYQCIVVLKGHHTSVSDLQGNISFNTTGNPGMATAGSGDTLTGIITGLLAQGYTPLDAAKTGVFIHGLAGDLAADEKGEQALIASDISDYLSKAWIESGK